MQLAEAGSTLAKTRPVLERMGPTKKFLDLVSSFGDVIGDVSLTQETFIV